MRSVAFLVNDISAIGGSTKVTVQLAILLLSHKFMDCFLLIINIRRRLCYSYIQTSIIS